MDGRTDGQKDGQRQKIPESSCVKKETVDINIVTTSRNDD